MALRPVSELGLADATDVDARETMSTAPAAAPAPRRARPRRAAATTPASSRKRPRPAAAQPPSSAAGAPRLDVPLADEPTIFVQAMLAGELHQRLADASHVLAAEHSKLRKYKTILGSLAVALCAAG
jgi:hypothetical protein